MNVDLQSFQYTDIQSLKSLKNQAPSEDTLMVAAKQLEGVFLQMVLKSMRKANEAFESSMFSSQAKDFYQDFHDNQLALNIAQGNGLGLAEVIYNQLKPHIGSKTSVDTQLKSISLKAEPAPEQAKSMQPTEHEKPIQEEPDIFQDARDFIEYLAPIAKKALKGLSIDPKFVLAQAALETGWGKHIIKTDDGQNSHNMFNIKAHGWDGNKVIKSTLEFLQGDMRQVAEPFRMYENYQQSFEDYINLLKSPRYQQALNFADDAQSFFDSIHQSGYATDPNYTSKILKILNQDVFKMLGQLD